MARKNPEDDEVYRKKWYAKNREEILAYATRYREENRETIAAKQKAYYESHKPKVAAREKLYYQKNKERLAAEKKLYRQRTRAACAARDKAYSLTEAGQENILRHHLKRYKLTPEQFRDLSRSQGDVCAACKCECKTRRRLSVDHNHDTGAVRGLLCYACNFALGHLGDSIELIEMLLVYARTHR
jgi:alpha-amylase/alpha-mannosidase (GH57 family)